MQKRLFLSALSLSYRLPARILLPLAGRQPSVLMYHGIPRTALAGANLAIDAEGFATQMGHLVDRFHFLTLDQFLAGQNAPGRKNVLLTFDDGFANNSQVVAPILKRLGIPAVFFVSTRHCDPGKPLWASYLRALEQFFPDAALPFRGDRYPMDPAQRSESMARLTRLLLALTPHPSALYEAISNELPSLTGLVEASQYQDWWAGMSEEQIRQLDADPLFEVEAHTVDHPFLTRCDPREIRRQLEDNRDVLEAICKKKVRALAYPCGDYNAEVVAIAEQAGFSSGFAVTPLLGGHPLFEVPRSGVYRSAPEVAAFKATWARRMEGRG